MNITEFINMVYPAHHVELPFTEVLLPEFTDITVKDWQIRRKKCPMLRGYYNGIMEMPIANTIIALNHKNDLWMSVSPREIESHAAALHHMHGHTVIMGAGMGISLFNALLNDDVSKVTVIEKDQSVIDIIHELHKFKPWDNWHKVEFVCIDAFDYVPDSKVDFLWIDIWKLLGEEKAQPEVFRIQQNVKAKQVAWWGFELDFIFWMSKDGCDLPATESDYDTWVRSTKMPVFKPENIWELAQKAAENMVLN